MKTSKDNLSFHSFSDLNLDEIKLAEPSVAAGFPSPADDFVEMEINLQDYIVKNKDATFCVKVEGTSMTKAGINSGDIMIGTTINCKTPSIITIC